MYREKEPLQCVFCFITYISDLQVLLILNMTSWITFIIEYEMNTFHISNK